MRQIRRGVFETNSSSTHSICISKEKVSQFPESITFKTGEYGWEESCETNTANYLYTALLELDRDDLIDKLKTILDKYNVKYNFIPPEKHDWWGIDHSRETYEMVEGLFGNEDQLIRYLFGDSCIYTGNDNSYEESDMCCCAEETIWSEEECTLVPNPNHDDYHYEYYYKGN